MKRILFYLLSLFQSSTVRHFWLLIIIEFLNKNCQAIDLLQSEKIDCSMMQAQILILFLMPLLVSSLVNLICNGDFEAYPLTLQGRDSALNVQNFDYVFSNDSCWYTPLKVNFQVLNVSRGLNYSTKAADLNTNGSIKLCQNLSLSIGAIYTLNYTMLYDPILETGSLSALLDSSQISKITYTQSMISKTSVNFTAKKLYSELCFSSQQTFALLDLWGVFQFSPMVDDVSLVLAVAASESGWMMNGTGFGNGSALNINSTAGINYTNQSSLSPTSTPTLTPTPSPSPLPSPLPQPSPSPSPPPSPSTIQTPKKSLILPLSLTSQANYLDNSLTFTSTFNPSLYGLTLQAFSGVVIQIQTQVQKNVFFKLNQNGCLMLTIYPEYLYDIFNLQDIGIYFPEPFDTPLRVFQFDITIDGQSLVYTKMSQNQLKALQTIQPISQTLSSTVYQAYLILNSLSCTYLILSLIGFWNLSLMYYFLMLSSLPNYTINYMVQLLSFLYARVNIKSQIYQLLQINTNSNLLDFGFLAREKIGRSKGKFRWFGAFGISSNAMDNNFQSLVLIGFAIGKFLGFKVIVMRLPGKIKREFNLGWSSLFHRFVEEISGFAPFIALSALQSFLNLAQQAHLGKWNSVLQITFLASFIFLPVISLTIKQTKIDSMRLQPKIYKEKQLRLKRFQNIYKFTFFLFCLSLPIFIVLANKLIFELTIGSLIIYRCVLVAKNFRIMRWHEKIPKFTESLIWIVYHFTFVFYCLFDQVSSLSVLACKDAIRVCGFVVIICIFGGGLLDLLFVLLRFFFVGRSFGKKVYGLCKDYCCVELEKDNKISPEDAIDMDRKCCKKLIIRIDKSQFYFKSSFQIKNTAFPNILTKKTEENFHQDSMNTINLEQPKSILKKGQRLKPFGKRLH